jgi:hypothetical protein
MNIVKFEPRPNNHAEKRKEQLLEVVESMKQMVQEGLVTELVAVSLDESGDLRLHISCTSFVEAIGMFELGKISLLDDEA